jgi:putative membrane protein insertion efficiency factor
MIGARYIAIAVVRAYQIVLSPLKGMLLGTASSCRFHPTCSCYAIKALRAHGLLRGSLLAGWRLLRCNPWGGSGFDPVPRTKSADGTSPLLNLPAAK